MPRKAKSVEVEPQIAWLSEMEQLYGKGSKFEKLLKAQKAKSDDSSPSELDNDNTSGLMPWPFDPFVLQEMRYGNVMHGRAIEAKTAATVGLGFVADEVEDKLDPLCQDLDCLTMLSDVCDDYYHLGNGFMEVVRHNGRITGLHHVPAASVQIYKENNVDFHYEINAQISGATVKMARFGELERKPTSGVGTDKFVSEMIHFPFTPSAFDRWYGVPAWLTAVPLIRTTQEILQFNFDFFQNRAVPELLILFLKQQIGPKDFQAFKDKFLQQRGPGNNHKTMVANLGGDNLEVQVEKLAEGKIDAGFLEAMDRYDLGVLAAHGVTPVLVGIQVSPKILGQSKEVRDNVQLVQALTIGPSQRAISKRLRRTLGEEIKGIPDQKRVRQEVSGVTQQMVEEKESGWSFRKLVDELEFDMSPQTGGPKPAGGGDSAAKKPSKPKASK